LQRSVYTTDIVPAVTC